MKKRRRKKLTIKKRFVRIKETLYSYKNGKIKGKHKAIRNI